MQLIFATHNKNKVREVKALMPADIELLSLDEINFHENIEETEITIEGNALLKAKTIFKKTGINCFADDSGLLVDALNGDPGVYSARYAGEQKNDNDNIDKLLKELYSTTNRKAHFKTVMALIIGGTEHLFEGVINGTITHETAGANGFGYDPVFMPDGHTTTFAQMSFEEKSAISHRVIALNKLIAFLKK